MQDAGSHVPKFSRRRLLQTSAAAAIGLSGAVSSPTVASPVRRVGRSTGAAARGTATITFALTTDDLARIAPLLDEYAARTGVQVQPHAFPYPELYEELTVSLTLGSCDYDVVSLDDPWMPLYAGGHFLMNLDELIRREGVEFDREDFVPGFLALGHAAGVPGLRAVPWIGAVQVFAWRDDVLRELGRERPETWDDVVDLARAVNEAYPDQDLFGIGLRGQAGNAAATTFLPILRGYGVDVFDAGWEPQLESDAAQAAMATLLTLAALAPSDVKAIGHEELARYLYTGRIAQAADIWPNQVLQTYDPALSDVVGAVAIGSEPAQPGVKPSNMTGSWLLGIPEGCTANAAQALDFILWLTDREQQKRLLLGQQIPATRLSVLRDPEAVAELPFLPGLLEAAQSAVPRPRTEHYAAVEEILGRWVAQAIAGEIGGEEALAGANREIRDLMVREGVLEG